jgi:AhpD family alkylhydroperoxidase
MPTKVKEFNEYRQKMNDKILASDNKVIKRIFNLDTNAFKEGHLPLKTKELLGLVASTVLRCDDCIQYHLESAMKRSY